MTGAVHAGAAPRGRRPRRRAHPAALLALIVSGVACRSAAAREEDWLEARPAPPIAGRAASSGASIAWGELRGRALLLSFGYTSCSDICPTTLASMGRVLSLLGAKAERVKALYVTIDPERDTLSTLRSFLGVFDPRIEGVWVEPTALPELLRAYAVVATRRPANLRRYLGSGVDLERDYSLDHTAALWVIDARGQLRVRYSLDASSERIAHGLERVLEASELGS